MMRILPCLLVASAGAQIPRLDGHDILMPMDAVIQNEISQGVGNEYQVLLERYQIEDHVSQKTKLQTALDAFIDCFGRKDQDDAITGVRVIVTSPIEGDGYLTRRNLRGGSLDAPVETERSLELFVGRTCLNCHGHGRAKALVPVSEGGLTRCLATDPSRTREQLKLAVRTLEHATFVPLQDDEQTAVDLSNQRVEHDDLEEMTRRSQKALLDAKQKLDGKLDDTRVHRLQSYHQQMRAMLDRHPIPPNRIVHPDVAAILRTTMAAAESKNEQRGG